MNIIFNKEEIKELEDLKDFLRSKEMKEKPAISIAKIYLAGFLAGAKFGTDKAI